MDSTVSAIMKSRDDFEQEIDDQIIQSKDQIRELMTALEQSQVEFNRLTQKKAAVTAQLQKVQTNIDSSSKQEIRDLFTQAMDAQQRLLIMRGQIEKNQIQLSSLNNLVDVLQQTREYISTSEKESTTSQKTIANTEMVKMLILAHEVERQRLSRQMHDGPAQTLSNFIVQAEIISKLYEIDPSKAKDEIEKLKNASINTFQKIRTYMSDLRPMSLEELGLIPATRKLLSSVKDQTGVETNLILAGNEREMEDYLEVYLFRSTQDILANIVDRNQDMLSNLSIEVDLQFEPGQVTLIVLDNGKNQENIIADKEEGVGLLTIKERAELLGGSFLMEPASEGGTQITVRVPLSQSTVT